MRTGVLVWTLGSRTSPRSSQKRELNMEKNASSQTQQQQRKRQTLHSSIYNLIKCYEPDFTRKKSICSTTSDVQGSSCTIDRSRSCSSDRNTLSSIISNTVSARLSQLSIESLERINSWLSNPMDNSDCNTINNTLSGPLSPQSLSNKEIDKAHSKTESLRVIFHQIRL